MNIHTGFEKPLLVIISSIIVIGIIGCSVAGSLADNIISLIVLNNVNIDTVSPYEALIKSDDCNVDSLRNCPILIVQGIDQQLYLQIEGAQKRVKLDPTRITTLFAKGGVAYQNSDPDRAVEIWKQINGVEAYFWRLAEDTEDSEEQLRLYQLSLDIHPTLIAAYQYALALRQNNEYQKSLEIFNDAILLAEPPEESTYLPLVYDELGNTYRLLGDYDNAKVSYEKALGLKNDLVSSIIGLAILDMISGNNQRAIDRLEKAWADIPDNPHIPYRIAEAYWRNGNDQKAIDMLNTILDDNKDFLPAWQLLGNIFEVEGKLKEACNAVSSGLTLMPENSVLLEAIQRFDCEFQQ